MTTLRIPASADPVLADLVMDLVRSRAFAPGLPKRKAGTIVRSLLKAARVYHPELPTIPPLTNIGLLVDQTGELWIILHAPTPSESP